MTDKPCDTCGQDKRHLCPFHPVKRGYYDERGKFHTIGKAPCRDVCERVSR